MYEIWHSGTLLETSLTPVVSGVAQVLVELRLLLVAEVEEGEEEDRQEEG